MHDKFSHSLKVRLNWSKKNVNDERDSPFQLVLGSMNHIYSVLWSLGLSLKLSIKQPAMESPYLFSFCDDFRIPEGRQKAKSMIQSFLTKMFKRREFHKEEENAKFFCWARTVFVSLHVHMFVLAVSTKMKKTLERGRLRIRCI